MTNKRASVSGRHCVGLLCTRPETRVLNNKKGSKGIFVCPLVSAAAAAAAAAGTPAQKTEKETPGRQGPKNRSLAAAAAAATRVQSYLPRLLKSIRNAPDF